MAIILDYGIKYNEYEIKHNEKYGFYKDFSKIFNKKYKNANTTSNTEKNMAESCKDILNKVVNDKTDNIQNLNTTSTQKIYYNDIYYQKIVYGNSISLGMLC